jgi:hypothetical protein
MTFAKKNTAAPSSGESLNMTKNESPAHAPWLSWLQRPTVKYYGASEGREFEPHWGSGERRLFLFHKELESPHPSYQLSSNNCKSHTHNPFTTVIKK